MTRLRDGQDGGGQTVEVKSKRSDDEIIWGAERRFV